MILPLIACLSSSLTYTSQNYTTRQTYSTSSSIVIENCFFSGISTSSSGGSIYISDTTCNFVMEYTTINSSTSTGGMGGGSYVYSNTTNAVQCIYSSCSGNSNGLAIYHQTVSSQINNLTSSSLIKCSNSGTGNAFASWCLSGGYCTVNAVNVSLAYATWRESGGHYTDGPPCHTLFSQFCSCTGPYIFGPYYAGSDTRYHVCISFINNTATTSEIILWSGSHQVQRSIFYNNSAIPITTSAGSLSFLKCAFDCTLASVNGYTTSSCIFNILNKNSANVWLGCLVSTNSFTSPLRTKLSALYYLGFILVFESE